MKFSIHGKTSVRTFKKTLLEQFGLSVKVHRGFSMGHFADDDLTVAANRSDRAEGFTGEFELHGNMKVGTAEQAIREGMGFAVQILDASGSLADNEVTIGSLRADFRSPANTRPDADIEVGPEEAASDPDPGGVEGHAAPPALQSSPPPPPPIAPPPPSPPVDASAAAASLDTSTHSKNRFIAGVLAIVLGSLGVHKFYLGYRAAGAIQAAATILCVVMSPDDEAAAKSSAWTAIGGLLVLFAWIEGILYMTKSAAEFDRVYVHGKRQVL